jgi:alanine dehydrogenase
MRVGAGVVTHQGASGDGGKATGSGRRETPSSSAARCQGEGPGSGAGARTGLLARTNCSIAAITAAASSAETCGATIVSFGRRFTGSEAIVLCSVTEIPVLDRNAVLSAVSPAEAIEQIADALVRHHRGEWVMPAKVYLDGEPDAAGAPAGDFRAMPARGDGLALLKWITSFPANPERGLPTVTGVVCLSDARTGELLMLLDAGAVTALRTGAVAAVASRALALPGARTVGIIGCGEHGIWTARCLHAAGYGPGICFDPRVEAATALAEELGWNVATRIGEATASEIVSCITPGSEPVLDRHLLKDGTHLNMLGADAPGKAEMEIAAVPSCTLFCDEWEQASHGGELTGAVRAGLVTREQVSELGAVLTGEVAGRTDPAAITLFDSTGLAIQDLAIARAALGAWRDGRVQAERVRL